MANFYCTGWLIMRLIFKTQLSLTSKMMQTMSLGMIKQNKRVEFVRMRGPKSKGHAEIAVSRVPGSGPETPNKENFKLEDFNNEQVFMKAMLFKNYLVF